MPRSRRDDLSFRVMRVEEIIGERIHTRRDELGLTQEQLGARVGERLGREWTRQSVSAAEKGKRAFTAAELVSIANVLGTSVGRLLTPPPNVDAVRLGPTTDAVVTSHTLAAAIAHFVSGESLDALQDVTVHMAEHLNALNRTAELLGLDLDKIIQISAESVVQTNRPWTVSDETARHWLRREQSDKPTTSPRNEY